MKSEGNFSLETSENKKHHSFEDEERLQKQHRIRLWCQLVLSDSKLNKKNALNDFESVMSLIPQHYYSSKDFLNLMNGSGFLTTEFLETEDEELVFEFVHKFDNLLSKISSFSTKFKLIPIIERMCYSDNYKIRSHM